MSKLKIAAYALLGLLIVSMVIDVSLYDQVYNLGNQKDTATARLSLTSVLTQAQTQIDAQLKQIDAGMALTCAALSDLDLMGNQARILMSELVASNSYIVNAATADSNDTLLVVQPPQYGSIEAVNIRYQEQNIKMHASMRPAMSDMILLVEGFYGVVMVAPIFNSSGTFVGSLSVVIQPGEIIKAAVVPALKGTSFSMWAMQPNGTLLYDPDPLQEGKNLFTEPIYVDYPTVQEFAHQVANTTTGYGTYQYHQDTLDGKLADKEAYWTTAGIYGAQWRLVVLHIIGS